MTDQSTRKEESQHTEDPPVAIAPDGGWGWVVCFCSFMQSVLIDGLSFSFGILFTEFLDFYKESKGKTSWAGSVLNGTYMVMGPLAASMVNKFGCRKVAIFGATLASVSLFISMFSPSVDILIFTYGFLVGTGFGFLYLPAIVIVGHYFDKKRALATGIAVCGSGIGGFIFAPMVELLLLKYHLKGALMILSGIILNGTVFACFYRPISVRTNQKQQNLEDTTNETNKDKNVSCNGNDKPLAYQLQNEINGKVTHDSDKHPSSDKNKTEDQEILKFALSQDMAHLMERNDCCKRTVHHHFRSRHDDNKQTAHVNKKSNPLRLTQSQNIASLQAREAPAKEIRRQLNPLMRKDIFYSGSIQHLPEYKEMGHDKFVEKMMDTRNERNSESDTGSVGRRDDNICFKAWKTVTSILDFSLLKSITFDIYGFSCFLCMLGFFIPFTYLPDMCKDFDISLTKSAMLISIIGITNTAGRILVGYLSDRPWADCLLINNIALTLCGISVVVMPLYINYAVLAVYCVIFGMGIAAFVSLRPIIMVDLLGIEKLTNSFGLVTLCQGLSSYIGSPIAGSISDWTGSYQASFYLSGITLTTAGLICFPLRRIARWENNRKEHKNALGCETEGMLDSKC